MNQRKNPGQRISDITGLRETAIVNLILWFEALLGFKNQSRFVTPILVNEAM